MHPYRTSPLQTWAAFARHSQFSTLQQHHGRTNLPGTHQVSKRPFDKYGNPQPYRSIHVISNYYYFVKYTSTQHMDVHASENANTPSIHAETPTSPHLSHLLPNNYRIKWLDVGICSRNAAVVTHNDGQTMLSQETAVWSLG